MKTMTVAQLRKAISTVGKNSRKFDIIQNVSTLANQTAGDYDPVVQELVLRLLDQRSKFSEYDELINALALRLGLYPYVEGNQISVRDALLVELHRPTIRYENANSKIGKRKNAEQSFVFHRAQSQVFAHLMDGENVILSAPTSFGKSAVIDALVDSEKYSQIIIIVPTIALIDETRRRLARFVDYKIITHSSQRATEKNIYLLTQERALSFAELPHPDILVIDEFYKLDTEGNDERAVNLNIIFYRLVRTARQFYLLGPNIYAIPDGFPARFSCRFIRTDFSTVVTDIVQLRPEKGEEENELLKLCRSIDQPTLIYCSSPSRASKVARAMLEEGLGEKSEELAETAEWIGENYHPDWTLVEAIRSGIAIHHGKMPRAIAQILIKAFNDGKVRFLICTSTLIEGVNTKAKNVLIFDNKIAREKLDYFTFTNIRGRSGRMFEHFIGKVYLFHDAPQADLPFVDIPIFTQDSVSTPESLLIQMDASDLKPESARRLDELSQRSPLSEEILKVNLGVEPSRLISLANFLLASPRSVSDLCWQGLPKYEQLKTVCELIWQFLVPEQRLGSVSSGSQLAFRLNQLRRNSLREIIENDATKSSPDTAVENLLDFIRQWPQFRFGRLAGAVASVRNAVAQSVPNSGKANYTAYIAQVENLFAGSAITALDEYGVPFPLAKKISQWITKPDSLDDALVQLKRLDVKKLNLSTFERRLIKFAREDLP